MKIYDCIIAGAGPAGLSCAIELGKKGLSAVVLEKNRVGETSHSWLIGLDEIHRYQLRDAIRREISCLTFRSFLGPRYRLQKPFMASVFEKKFLLLLAEQARKFGIQINEQEAFISYHYEKDCIIATTARALYAGRLLIDAMGEGSRIPEGMGINMRHSIVMECYGYDLTGVAVPDIDETLIFDAFFSSWKCMSWIFQKRSALLTSISR